jgi:hypothetical protein
MHTSVVDLSPHLAIIAASCLNLYVFMVAIIREAFGKHLITDLQFSSDYNRPLSPTLAMVSILQVSCALRLTAIRYD